MENELNSGKNMETLESSFYLPAWIRESLLYRVLITHRYLHFFVVGSSGILVLLFITWFFNQFVFGVENYFKGYLVGMVTSLVYAFILHTIVTFRTNSGHGKRFITYVFYNLTVAFLQAILVRFIVPLFDMRYYLAVIACIVFTLSTATYLFFKFYLFNESKPIN